MIQPLLVLFTQAVSKQLVDQLSRNSILDFLQLLELQFPLAVNEGNRLEHQPSDFLHFLQVHLQSQSA